MSKYAPLWQWIAENKSESFTLTYEEIEQNGGVPIDHSFLNAKKELEGFGFRVGKISMKNRTVRFEKQ